MKQVADLAVITLGPVLYVLVDFRNFRGSIGRILRWTSEDFVWLRTSARFYWLGQRRGIPPQGKYDTGQKLNAVIQMECFVVFVVTGALMWFWGPALSPAVFRLSVILHDVAFVFAFGFFLALNAESCPRYRHEAFLIDVFGATEALTVFAAVHAFQSFLNGFQALEVAFMKVI